MKCVAMKATDGMVRGMKAVDTGPFRAVALGVPQPAVAEFPPAVAEPQRRGSGESVTAPGTSDGDRYVQSVRVDGSSYGRTYLKTGALRRLRSLAGCARAEPIVAACHAGTALRGTDRARRPLPIV